jgi:hypothetical protein
MQKRLSLIFCHEDTNLLKSILWGFELVAETDCPISVRQSYSSMVTRLDGRDKDKFY